MESLSTIGLKSEIVAGCDEAGRGPLAGPVYAAAVIFPSDFSHPLVRDSKKLSKNQREEAAIIVKENAVAWAVASSSVSEIDEMNILCASILAMQRAVVSLYDGGLQCNRSFFEDRGGSLIKPTFLIIDGNRFYKFKDGNGDGIPFRTIVKGDSLYSPIAAASILAKTYRDEYMEGLARQYPMYGWDHNMAYSTEEHREAIKVYGLTPHHRRTFIHPKDGRLF